jgi:hypothetical protein
VLLQIARVRFADAGYSAPVVRLMNVKCAGADVRTLPQGNV